MVLETEARALWMLDKCSTCDPIYLLIPQSSIKLFSECWVPCLYFVCTLPESYTLASNLKICQSKRSVSKRKRPEVRAPGYGLLCISLFFTVLPRITLSI